MKDSPAAWQTLQQSADRYRQTAAHEQAIELYSQALSLPDVPWAAHFAMTMTRAESRQNLGDIAGLDGELTALAEQAAQKGDDAVQAAALAELALALRFSGDMPRSLQVSRQALEAAEKSGHSGLKAEALAAMGIAQLEMGEFDSAQESLQAAEALPLTSEDALGQVKIDYLKVLSHVRIGGKFQQALQTAEHGLSLARQAGLRGWQGVFLNNISISTPDLALQGSLMEQTLEAFEVLGDRPRQSMMLMNIGSFLINLGLYKQAIEYVRQSLEMARRMHQDQQSTFALQFLGLAYLEFRRHPQCK